MNPVFLDTSAFVALVDRDDEHHGRAKRFLRSISKRRRSLITSTYVLDEVFTLVRLRVGHGVAVRLGDQLSRTRWCQVMEVDETLRLAAWQILVRYADQVFSFTDCTSFALMRALNVSEAFTFDHRDYRSAGFSVVP